MSSSPRNGARWDLFMAARTSEINRALAKSVQINRFYPPEGDYGEKISASIESWRIVDQLPGFQVKATIRTHVIFELTLKDFTLSGGLLLAEGQTISLPQVRTYISVGLKYVRAHEDTDTHHLVIDPPPPPDPQGHMEEFSWAVDKTDFSTPESKSGIAVLQVALGKWAADHWDDFAHIFATIDVFDGGDSRAQTWLQPTAVDYAYAAAENPADSVLCVLAMTRGRKPDHNRDVVLPTALPEDAAAFFHIDRDTYLEGGIMPGLGAIANGASPPDFKYTGQTGRITLASNRIALPTQNIGHNAETHTRDFPCPAQINSVQLEILDDAIVTQFESQITVRERRGTTFSNFHTGTSRTIYDDRDAYLIFCRQTRFLTASVKADSADVAHVVIKSDDARKQDKHWSQKAPKSTIEAINDYMLMGAEMLTALVIPPLGAAELLATTAINTAIQLIGNDQIKNNKSFGGVPVPSLLTAINVRWGGFDHLSATDASIDDGLSVVGELRLSE